MRESPLEEDTGFSEGSHAVHRILGAPDQALSSAIDRVILERAVRELAPGFRMVFLLHDLEGYDHSEIAAMLGVRVGTSKSQLHKARCHLRLLLRSPDKLGSRGTLAGDTLDSQRWTLKEQRQRLMEPS